MMAMAQRGWCPSIVYRPDGFNVGMNLGSAGGAASPITCTSHRSALVGRHEFYAGGGRCACYAGKPDASYRRIKSALDDMEGERS